MTDLDLLARSEKEQLILALQEEERRERENQLFKYFKDAGPLSRDKYLRTLMFFRAGKHYKERAMIAANRSGKSLSACWEMALHLTGLYKEFPWWEGKVFDEPIQAWSIGKTHETTRDILQRYLLGPR